MAKLSISLIADVTSFLRGITQSEKALDDTADSLDDLARDAARAGDRAGDGLADGVQDGTDRVETSFRDMARAASRYSKDAGDDLGREVDRGAHEASEGLDTLNENAGSNAKEVAASFDGSIDSIADGFQGLAAEAFEGFGPAGLVAGVALASIGGALYSSITENAAKSEQRISDMYEDFLESGADFLSKEYVADQLGKIYQGAEDAAISIERLRSLATDADIPEPLLARALVGDEAARREVDAQISAKRLAINEALDEATARGENLAPTLSPAIQALQDIEGALDGVAGNAKTAQENARMAGEAIAGIDASRAAASAEDARAKFDGLGRKIAELPPVKEVRLDLDTADLDRQVRAYTPPRVIVTGELEVRAGQRVV